jgi:hypothetical protein
MKNNPTTSLDLPPVLAQLLGPMTPPVTQDNMNQQQFNPSVGLSSGMGQSNPTFMPSYAAGGMVGGGGMPDMQGMGVGGMQGMQGMQGAPAMPGGQPGLQPQGAKPANMNSQQLELQLQDFMRKNPQAVQQIASAIEAGVQSGEVTPEELNQAGQLALTALQNPEMYPYIRKFAIEQGFADEQSLSPEYDQGLVFTILLAVRSMGSQGGQPPMQSPEQMQSFAMGGMVDGKVTAGEDGSSGGKVEGPGTGTSDSVPIRVSTGEYVIPAHVVKMKGKEFFDSMLEKYKG